MTPMQGRFATFGAGLQTDAGTEVVATNWLALTENANVIADPIKTNPEYAYESRFKQPSVLQGITFENKNVSGMATPAWVQFILGHMFGAPVAGVITPAGNTVDAELFPVKPLTLEIKNPKGNLKVIDTVCQELTLTLVERNSFTVSHVFSGLNPGALVSPTAAVIPAQADQWKYSEFTGKVGATAFPITAFTVTLKNGITTRDASGSLNKAGFAPSGMVEGVGSVTFQVPVPALEAALQASEGTATLEFNWVKGANKNMKLLGAGMVTSSTLPGGLDTISLTYAFEFVSVAGAAPFTLTFS